MSKHETFPSVKPKVVRIAGPGDAPQLRVLLDRLHSEVPNPADLPPDDEKVWATVHAACNGQGAIAGIIDGPGGEIIGSMGIFWNVPWWTSQGILSQYWKFVDPNYRYGGRFYTALMQFARWHRDDMRVRLGYPIHLEDSFIGKDNLKPRSRLWAKHGRCVGSFFLMKD